MNELISYELETISFTAPVELVPALGKSMDFDLLGIREVEAMTQMLFYFILFMSRC